MSTKKRAAIAVAVSAAAGSTAGAVAAYCGLDLQESAKLGALVSGAVGNLLYQALRLTPDQTDGSASSAAVDEADTPDEAAGEFDNNNASHGASDTADDTDETGPRRGVVEDNKLPRHRKLRRAGRRRVERNSEKKQDTRGEVGDHGAA
ncbi:hypothetical protein ACFU7X_46630 [Streptomyces chartreusis]|uniref:hypothetical protein n=1 Tax=Streptomyces chartreusis TaxID=1969 RepID=UPI0036C739F5